MKLGSFQEVILESSSVEELKEKVMLSFCCPCFFIIIIKVIENIIPVCFDRLVIVLYIWPFITNFDLLQYSSVRRVASLWKT